MVDPPMPRLHSAGRGWLRPSAPGGKGSQAPEEEGEQCLEPHSSQQLSPRAMLPPRGHSTMSRDVCGCHNLEVLLASSGWGWHADQHPAVHRAEKAPP